MTDTVAAPDQTASAARSRRPLLGAGVILLVVVGLVVGWLKWTSHVLDHALSPGVGPVVCNGRSQFPSRLVRLQTGEVCTASLDFYYDGPASIDIDRIDFGIGGQFEQYVPVDGRSPSHHSYPVDATLSSSEQTHRYRVAFRLRPGACGDPGITVVTPYMPIEVSYLGRHRTIQSGTRLRIAVAKGAVPSCD